MGPLPHKSSPRSLGLPDSTLLVFLLHFWLFFLTSWNTWALLLVPKTLLLPVLCLGSLLFLLCTSGSWALCSRDHQASLSKLRTTTPQAQRRWLWRSEVRPRTRTCGGPRDHTLEMRWPTAWQPPSISSLWTTATLQTTSLPPRRCCPHWMVVTAHLLQA